MNNLDLYYGFSEVDDDLLQRSENATVSRTVPRHRRLSFVLIAAILALLLMGSGIVVTIWGDDIQDFYALIWEKVTGQSMSDQHIALIDRLSQQIGISETVDGVTVTVDSVTVGTQDFAILLRAEGLEFSKRRVYGFDETKLEMDPKTLEDVSLSASYSYQFLGFDADGAILMVIRGHYTATDPFRKDPPPLTVTLSMTNFVQSPWSDDRVLLAEGVWEFTFSMDRHELDLRDLPDTQVTGVDSSGKDAPVEAPVTLTNIVLTNLGLSFQYNRQGGDVFLDIHIFDVKLVLDSGQEIVPVSSAESALQDGIGYCTYTWMLPANLDEVAALEIGDAVIPIA